MNTAKLSSKRKMPDVNDNFDVFAAPAPPPPALRARANSRRMTIAGGTLPATPGLGALLMGAPSQPAQAQAQGSHASQARRQAEEDHADSLFNNYITTLALKHRTQKIAAGIRQELDVQLSMLQNDSNRMAELIVAGDKKRNILPALLVSAAMVEPLPTMLAENGLKKFNELRKLSSSVNEHMNSLKCIGVRPVSKEQDEFREVTESLNELGENFCIPRVAMENCVTTAGCLHAICNSTNTVKEENKSLNQLKDTNYHLLTQNISSTMKL